MSGPPHGGPASFLVALLTASGHLAERISYTPYGDTVTRANIGDVDGSGFVDSSDFNMFAAVHDTSMENDPGDYILNADFNADGAIDTGDFSILAGGFNKSSAPIAGAISTVGNTIGYAGYVWDPALGGATSGMYLARHRWYSTNLGRWVSRDPIGYAGGDMNFYGYVGGMPGVLTDPTGLSFWDGVVEGVVGVVVGVVVVAVVVATLPATAAAAVLVVGAAVGGYAAGVNGYEAVSGHEAYTHRQLNADERGTRCGHALIDAATFVGAPKVVKDILHGAEYNIGKNMRIAPWGSPHAGHPTGRSPHYHRRVIDPATGKTVDGQGMKWHRPWEKGW